MMNLLTTAATAGILVLIFQDGNLTGALGFTRPDGIEQTDFLVLLAVALGAFVTSQLVFLKELGVGAALAVLIDAFAVRGLLVPSLMGLLGSANWWSPRPLRRLHDRLDMTESSPG